MALILFGLFLGIFLPYFGTTLDLLLSMFQSKVSLYNSRKQAEINQILLESEQLNQSTCNVMGFSCEDVESNVEYEDYEE